MMNAPPCIHSKHGSGPSTPAGRYQRTGTSGRPALPGTTASVRVTRGSGANGGGCTVE